MPNIYDQHQAAFARVSAWVILHNGKRVATVAAKFPQDGAARLSVYVHWLGAEMVRGTASGYGYDKLSAAVANAAKRFNHPIQASQNGSTIAGIPADEYRAKTENRLAFFKAIVNDSGRYWYDRLADAGFTVLQAV